MQAEHPSEHRPGEGLSADDHAAFLASRVLLHSLTTMVADGVAIHNDNGAITWGRSLCYPAEQPHTTVQLEYLASDQMVYRGRVGQKAFPLSTIALELADSPFNTDRYRPYANLPVIYIGSITTMTVPPELRNITADTHPLRPITDAPITEYSCFEIRTQQQPILDGAAIITRMPITTTFDAQNRHLYMLPDSSILDAHGIHELNTTIVDASYGADVTQLQMP